jgi:predicted transcriptional regulator
MSERTFKIRLRDDLINAPDPAFLIDQLLPEKSLAVLVGAPGVGKTFLALDLALCICTNINCLGYETQVGQVIYITSEGLSGLKLRLLAWEHYHGVEVKNFGYITEAPQLLDENESEWLIKSIKASNLLKPALIVIDTLARHMVGGDENSSLSMGEFVANVDKLRNAFNCAVIIVHHTGKKRTNSFSERGSSALRGAADTMLLMDKNKNEISITCEKQKDSEPFEEIVINLLSVELPDNKNSCVIVRKEICIQTSAKLEAKKEKILSTLLEHDPSGLKPKQIIAITKTPESSYYRHQRELLNNSYIESTDQQQYVLTEKGKQYALTLNPLSTNSHESLTATPITPTHL